MTLALVVSTPRWRLPPPQTRRTASRLIANVAGPTRNYRISARSRTDPTGERQQGDRRRADRPGRRGRGQARWTRPANSRSRRRDAITDAQRKFDTFAAAAYVNGPGASCLLASSPEEFIATASAGQTLATSSAGDDRLQRARTEQVNKVPSPGSPSRGRSGRPPTQTSMETAVASLKSAQDTFAEQQARSTSSPRKATAQAKLEAARGPATRRRPRGQRSGRRPGAPPRGAASDCRRLRFRVTGTAPARASVKPPYGDASEWDMTLPMIPSAFISGDPIQIINAVLLIAQTALQFVADLGRSSCRASACCPPPRCPPTAARSPTGWVDRRRVRHQARHVADRRAVLLGRRHRAGTELRYRLRFRDGGFDCSGLVLMPFAGVGIKLLHYSGSQYNMGRKIPSVADAPRRRHLLRPRRQPARDHLPRQRPDARGAYTPDPTVKISLVRTSGMTPFVVRYINTDWFPCLQVSRLAARDRRGSGGRRVASPAGRRRRRRSVGPDAAADLLSSGRAR